MMVMLQVVLMLSSVVLIPGLTVAESAHEQGDVTTKTVAATSDEVLRGERARVELHQVDVPSFEVHGHFLGLIKGPAAHELGDRRSGQDGRFRIVGGWGTA